jgi:nucleoside-diphosphate-sugar epimerase
MVENGHMKVLVIGGAGYIGGAVTDVLTLLNIPFSVYDNLTYEQHYFKPVEFIYGDVRDRAKLVKLLPRYTHVIWLAAIVGDPACAINPALTKEINQDAVEWLAKHYNGRIMFTSTCSVYGIQNEPVTEKSPTNPISVYAQTKLAAENFLKDKNSIIFRLGTAYGISDNYSRLRMDLAVNYMTMNAIKKGKLTVYGGAQWRPFIHVKDIGHFLVDNLNKRITGTYNVATENETVIRLAEKIKKETNCAIEITEQKFQDQRNYHAITDKALRDGIIPTSTSNDIVFGIKQIKKIVEENRVNNLENEFYSNERRMLAIMEDYKNGTLNHHAQKEKVHAQK